MLMLRGFTECKAEDDIDAKRHNNQLENPNVYTEDNRNTLVVCDILEKMNDAAPFCKKITTIDDLDTLTTKATNPEIYDFASIFFGLAKRPQYFWLAACFSTGSSGGLTTATLDAWDAFKAKFVKEGGDGCR